MSIVYRIKHGKLPSRRAFLAGGAALVGLPLMESLWPRSVRAQALTSPRRLLYYYVPNGIDMATFIPSAPGAGYPMPVMLTSLESLRADFSVVSGLANMNAKPDQSGDHASGTTGFITCMHAVKASTTFTMGTSADQLAANVIGKATRIPSMQLGIDGGGSTGTCDSGYSCAYVNNISWANATTPLAKITDPAKAFDQIFAGVNPNESAAAAANRRALDQSVLDAVKNDCKSLALKLGKSDNLKLDQYLTGVRALETKLASGASVGQCTPGAKPAATSDYPTKVTQMHDLMVMAMQCDATRVISFMLGNAGSNRTYGHIGVPDQHHPTSHHRGDPVMIAKLVKIGTWEVEQLGSLMTKMKAVKEGADDMLYNSTVFFGSEISDGNSHSHENMPIILGGHGGGVLNPGRHVPFLVSAKQKVSDLLLTTLTTVGVTGATLGDSGGPLAGV